MKKTWNNAEITELNIQATAGGGDPAVEGDGVWVQINGVNYEKGVPREGAES